MRFGEKLRVSRKNKGLTQAELAKQAELGIRTIIAYEKGETYPQKRSTYLRLAKLLDVPANYLLSEEIPEESTTADDRRQAVFKRFQSRVYHLLSEESLSHETYTLSMADLSETFYQEIFGGSKELKQTATPLHICLAQEKDIPTVLNICAHARAHRPDLPSLAWDFLREDIEKSQLYIVKEKENAHAVFSLSFEEIPCAAVLWQEGGWQTAPPCGTLLHFFSGSCQMNIFGTLLHFCKSSSPALRAVVEQSDLTFRLALEQRDFVCCGKFADSLGRSFLAYEMSKTTQSQESMERQD